MNVWNTEDDARNAADDLVKMTRLLDVPSWSCRELELMRLATPVAKVKCELGPFHPFLLVFSERLHELLDAHGYREIWKAVIEVENGLTASLYRCFRSARPAG